MKNKFKKLLSVVLSICLLLSVCFVAGVMTVSAEEKVYNYYVKGNGTGNGSSPDTPAPTVQAALEYMVASGNLTATDTATIWIMQDAAELYGTSNRKHNLAYWGSEVQHDNIIKVKPYKGNTFPGGLKETVLLDSSQLGSANAKGFCLGGPTVFENIKLVYNHQTNYSKGTIVTEGNSLTIDTTVDFASIQGNSLKDYTAAEGVTSLIVDIGANKIQNIRDSINSTSSPKVYEKPYTVTITHAANGLQGPDAYTFGDASATFKENATLIMDFQKSGVERIYLGSEVLSYSLSGVTSTYEKDINIKIRNASSFALRNDKATPLIIWGGINMIVSDTVGGTAPATSLSTAGFTKNKAGTGNAAYYIVNVADAMYNYVNFYGETGKFAIDANYAATATHKTTGATVDSVNGLLDLSTTPGEYDIALTKVSSKVFDYYVKAGGTGDGTDINDPAPSIAAAVAGMNSLSLDENDTANIWVMQNDLTAIETNGATSATFTNIPFWGNIPVHKAKIVINPYKDNTYSGSTFTQTVVSLTNSVGDATGMAFGGPTVLGNIQLLYSTKSHVTNAAITKINLAGNDVTISDNASFAYINANGANTYPEGHENAGKQYNAAGWPTDVTSLVTNFNGMMSTWLTRDAGETAVEYDNPINVVINKGMQGTSPDSQRFYVADSNSVFNENVTITMDVAETDNQRFDFGVTQHATFKKNLNLKLISSKNFGYSGSAVVDGGFQFILSKSAGFHQYYPYADIDNKLTKSDGSAADSWIILVGGEDIGFVDFQGETGKFIASKPNCVAAAYDADNNLVKEADVDNVIDLSKTTGEFTIKFTEVQQETHVYDQGTNPFINYRGFNTSAEKYNGALANTYKKLTTGDKEINVVYFGGSVTIGTGVTDAEKDSWRGRIGSWLVDNFPEATVNNINKGAGETGTYLGSYRVARDIVSAAPDLLFIEYSINDYYDNRGYGYTGDVAYNRASFQFETIVRKVKEAYPDCDIITVLVTDVDCARNERNGVLHTEAQAHEDIAKKYNISSIHVGRVLAEKITQEGWNGGKDAIWAKYMRVLSSGYVDMVHPNAAGYDVYFQVIKEFMANTLFFGNYATASVQNQELPELVNSYLFDGEVTYIDENDKTKVTYPAGSITSSTTNQGVAYPDYQGLIFVPNGCQDIITVKFNGTELGMMMKHGHSEVAGNTYKVRVDGGEWKTYNYVESNPTYIASGLKAGDHVAEIIASPEIIISSISQYRISGFYSRNAEKATNKLNICALVALDETITDSTDGVRDYNNDDIVNENDFYTLRKMLLNNR